METTRLSSKGQVVIPKSLREAYNWQPGQEFVVVDTDDGVLLKAKRPFEQSNLDDVAGCLRYEGEAKSLAEMERAIESAIRADWHDRG